MVSTNESHKVIFCVKNGGGVMFLDLKTRISLEFVIRIQHLGCLQKADTQDKLIRVVICHGKHKGEPQSHFLGKT